jgi:hypothetical protein
MECASPRLVQTELVYAVIIYGVMMAWKLTGKLSVMPLAGSTLVIVAAENMTKQQEAMCYKLRISARTLTPFFRAAGGTQLMH